LQANTTARTRSCNPSFIRIRLTWVSAVPGVMTSSSVAVLVRGAAVLMP
jgi:hypothetical protein